MLAKNPCYPWAFPVYFTTIRRGCYDHRKILFYGIIIVGAALIIGLTYYRIDWARHPEKYQDLVDQAEKDEKEAAQRRAMRRLGRKREDRRKATGCKAGRFYTVSYCFPPDPVPTAAGPAH